MISRLFFSFAMRDVQLCAFGHGNSPDAKAGHGGGQIKGPDEIFEALRCSRRLHVFRKRSRRIQKHPKGHQMRRNARENGQFGA